MELILGMIKTKNVLKELKENHGIDLVVKVNNNEIKGKEEEEETYVDEVAEEIFHDDVSRDKKKLEEMLDNLSQEYDFSDLAMEIKNFSIPILIIKQIHGIVLP